MSDYLNIIVVCAVMIWLAAAIITSLVKRRKSAPTPPSGYCKANEHDLVPIEAQVLKASELAYAQTVVLHRCSRCGLHASPTFPGEWTIDHFLKKEADLNWLERAAK